VIYISNKSLNILLILIELIIFLGLLYISTQVEYPFNISLLGITSLLVVVKFMIKIDKRLKKDDI